MVFMKDTLLVSRTKRFSVEIITLCGDLSKRGKATPIINQLLRSGTSIGANVHEANYAASRADFINKFQIALKECYETAYWLEVFHDARIVNDEEFESFYDSCSRIRKKLAASITSAKKHLDQ